MRQDWRYLLLEGCDPVKEERRGWDLWQREGREAQRRAEVSEIQAKGKDPACLPEEGSPEACPCWGLRLPATEGAGLGYTSGLHSSSQPRASHHLGRPGAARSFAVVTNSDWRPRFQGKPERNLPRSSCPSPESAANEERGPIRGRGSGHLDSDLARPFLATGLRGPGGSPCCTLQANRRRGQRLHFGLRRPSPSAPSLLPSAGREGGWAGGGAQEHGPPHSPARPGPARPWRGADRRASGGAKQAGGSGAKSRQESAAESGRGGGGSRRGPAGLAWAPPASAALPVALGAAMPGGGEFRGNARPAPPPPPPARGGRSAAPAQRSSPQSLPAAPPHAAPRPGGHPAAAPSRGSLAGPSRRQRGLNARPSR
ncbi:collagen alpha-1(II) chain-like [Eublepharis macularius]|uniref:Collagen alpha-1(II) chain-like n=1 Tax=Eublepharis macularius TaxID=481883 RepID=A0AA97KHG5_EUBMA|nr:collagen alpha-1(II) chain-like [Eublepharis macularius]